MTVNKLKKTETINVYLILLASFFLLIAVCSNLNHFSFVFPGEKLVDPISITEILYQFFSCYPFGWLSLLAFIIFTSYTLQQKKEKISPDLFYGIARAEYSFFLFSVVCPSLLDSYGGAENFKLVITIHAFYLFQVSISFLIGSIVCTICTLLVMLRTKQKPLYSLTSCISLGTVLVNLLLYSLMELTIFVMYKLQ